MKNWRFLCLLAILWLAAGIPGSMAAAQDDVDAMLDRIEARYSGQAFTAGFVQVTTDKAMGIADEAEGTLHVKYPGKMRWVYEYPERHFFITDGDSVWIHKPDDNQVMLGKATEILGDSKGATFLSDIGLIRKRFDVTATPAEIDGTYRLQLVPKEQNLDITAVYLTVSRLTDEVLEVMTVNVYENETRIVFKDFAFRSDLPDDLFELEIPEGTDVLEYSP